MNATQGRDETLAVTGPDVGLLLLRLMVGAIGVFHGGGKLFTGLFGGAGPEGFAAELDQMGVPMPAVSAYLAGSAEFFGGLLVAAGVATRLAAVPFLFTMLVAAFAVHGKAFGLQSGGMEYALTVAVILASLILTGPGRLTLPALFERLRQPAGQPVRTG
jgi:putative oxidoreductase